MILVPPTRPLTDGTIVVRLPGEQDADALVRYGNDPDVAETIFVPIPTPCSRAQALQCLDDFKRGWHEESQFGPALTIAAAAATDGMIGVLMLRLREHASVELTYGVAASHRNRGVATAAVSPVTDRCLHELEAARVELRSPPPSFDQDRGVLL